MKTVLGIVLAVIFCPVVCWSEGKIYTNEDLEKYQEKKIQVVPAYPEEQNKNVGNRTILNIGRGSIPEESNKKVDREVNLYLAECPTYQGFFPGSVNANVGGGTVRLMTRGRSVKDLCDSIGQGCKICYEAVY